jgi:hypothetical protein
MTVAGKNETMIKEQPQARISLAAIVDQPAVAL